MKVGIFSDPHLGFDEKGERFEEAFQNVEQAIELCIEKGADFAVLPGDVFDAPVPSHTTLFRAFSAFSKAKGKECKVTMRLEKNGESKDLTHSGLPILTIHGNHEFLNRDVKTALDLLNLAGLVNYFHAGKVVVEKDGEKVCVHGLGAVPEKKALDVLNYWNPKPAEGCNILLLHQGFKDFMAIEDDMIASLSLDDLPKGFELIINGHLHWSNKQVLGESIFLLPGSTISTSIKRLEAEKEKGIFLFDTVSKELDFFPFPNQRKMFYHKLSFDSASQSEVIDKCTELIEKDLELANKMKPLIRFNLKGSLKLGLSPSDVDVSDFLDNYKDKALISLSKNFEGGSFKKKISELRDVQKERLSVVSMGFDLLEKNLKETDFGAAFDPKRFFDLLSENEIEEAMKLVTKKD